MKDKYIEILKDYMTSRQIELASERIEALHREEMISSFKGFIATYYPFSIKANIEELEILYIKYLQERSKG